MTDEGVCGYGEATVLYFPQSVQGMLRDLKPYLIGQDPMRIEYLWQSLFRDMFMRGGPAHMAAISGIDMALYDLKGKALNVPVYELGIWPGNIWPRDGQCLKTAMPLLRKDPGLALRWMSRRWTLRKQGLPPCTAASSRAGRVGKGLVISYGLSSGKYIRQFQEWMALNIHSFSKNSM